MEVILKLKVLYKGVKQDRKVICHELQLKTASTNNPPIIWGGFTLPIHAYP